MWVTEQNANVRFLICRCIENGFFLSSAVPVSLSICQCLVFAFVFSPAANVISLVHSKRMIVVHHRCPTSQLSDTKHMNAPQIGWVVGSENPPRIAEPFFLESAARVWAGGRRQ